MRKVSSKAVAELLKEFRPLAERLATEEVRGNLARPPTLHRHENQEILRKIDEVLKKEESNG